MKRQWIRMVAQPWFVSALSYQPLSRWANPWLYQHSVSAWMRHVGMCPMRAAPCITSMWIVRTRTYDHLWIGRVLYWEDHLGSKGLLRGLPNCSKQPRCESAGLAWGAPAAACKPAEGIRQHRGRGYPGAGVYLYYGASTCRGRHHHPAECGAMGPVCGDGTPTRRDLSARWRKDWTCRITATCGGARRGIAVSFRGVRERRSGVRRRYTGGIVGWREVRGAAASRGHTGRQDVTTPACGIGRLKDMT